MPRLVRSLPLACVTVLLGLSLGKTVRAAAEEGNAITKAPAGTPTVDFANDIVPLLTRYGCNSGGCHGKANGQNGFKLSLFGFDATFDYEAIVEAARGRR